MSLTLAKDITQKEKEKKKGGINICELTSLWATALIRSSLNKVLLSDMLVMIHVDGRLLESLVF